VPTKTLCLSQDAAADALLTRDPLALLIGMVLDQQIPLEKAFSSPYVLTQRLGHDLDAREIAAYEPDALAALFATPPALHRFPGSMAGRVQELCRVLVETYDGDAAAVWATGDAKELLRRIKGLPGFGEQKAKIFMALLGKQLGVRPRGWREVCAPYGDAGSKMSVADITGPKTLLEVRAYKQRMKAAAKAGATA
jgi:uncharacterized HhH-GPD family protein